MSAASSEKQEEYTTEPKNFVEVVEMMTAKKIVISEHIYKDYCVVETISEHSYRLWKESLQPLPEMSIDDNFRLSIGTFDESMSDAEVSREKFIVKNKNQNALIEQDTLKSLESENGKMSSNLQECKANVENGVSHNIETVNIPNGVRHSNSKDEIEEEASCSTRRR
jgi:hypothetical protein